MSFQPPAKWKSPVERPLAVAATKSVGTAAIRMPINGTKAKRPVTAASSAKYGTPTTQNPSMQNRPTMSATTSCPRKKPPRVSPTERATSRTSSRRDAGTRAVAPRWIFGRSTSR